MKKVKVTEPTKVKGLFGTKTVMKTKTAKVDNKTYKAMKKEDRKREREKFDEFAFWIETFSDD